MWKEGNESIMGVGERKTGGLSLGRELRGSRARCLGCPLEEEQQLGGRFVGRVGVGTVAVPAGDKQAERAYPRQMQLCTRVWKAGQPTYGSKLPGSESGLEQGTAWERPRDGLTEEQNILSSCY